MQWPFRGKKGKLHTTITNGSETIIIPIYSSLANPKNIFTNLYGIIIANTSGVGVSVTIRDMSNIQGNGNGYEEVIEIPAGETRGWITDMESAEEQIAPNEAWTAQVSQAVSNIEITTFFVRN